MTSDEELMLRAGRGDMHAFERLVERHQRGALGIAYHYLGRRGAAEDVVQDAFLRILEKAGSYRPTASFRTYLYRVIWHLCVDRYRRSTPTPLEGADPGADPAAGPEARAMQAERGALIEQAISELPDRQRMAVVLKYVEQMSYREIAEAMETTPSAVDSLLSRAREKLRAELEGQL
ncbi:MAG: sigma-70 family RNA polymerase sigma factor [Candidatus Brocadiia bacterium]